MENAAADHPDLGLESPQLTQLTSIIPTAVDSRVVAPTSPSTPQKIEREDLLEYKLLGSRAAHAELQVTMYERELQRSRNDVNTIAYEVRKYMEALATKYGVDLTTHMITDDGYLVPRPVDPYAALMRK